MWSHLKGENISFTEKVLFADSLQDCTQAVNFVVLANIFLAGVNENNKEMGIFLFTFQKRNARRSINIFGQNKTK